MKKTITILLLCAAIIITACDNKNVSAAMPLPFGDDTSMGGDELTMYYEPGNAKIESIPLDLARLEPTIDEWIYNNQLSENSSPSLMGHANLFSFIKTFNLDENTIREYLKWQNEWFIEMNQPEYTLFTEEDLNIIFTLDDAKANEYFASDYSVVYGGKVYSPEWIYNHSIEDYQAENIPVELIQAKREMYDKIPFTDEARKALDEKLTSYSEKTNE